MMITKMLLSLESGWTEMRLENDLWHCDGAEVSVNNGEVKLSTCLPVLGLRLEFENDILPGAYILGDAWERAYGDLKWLSADKDRVMPWYFIAWDGGRAHCYGVKTQPNALCYWNYDGTKAVLTADLRSGTCPVELGGRTLQVCTLIHETLEGDLHQCCARFCADMCPNPRKVDRPIFGGNDWYCNYGDNSFDKILLHTKRIAACAQDCAWKPYMVIDDGWQLCHRSLDGEGGGYNGGPWRYCNANFGDMKAMADAILAEGVIPGIWMRPLQTLEKMPASAYLSHSNNEMPLDPSQPLVLEKIRQDVRTIVSWGYKLIKHDFSSADIFGKWGVEMGSEPFRGEVRFADRTKTTAEIIKGLYMAIREAAGEDVLIMGCNTFSHLSAGIMDIQRTGDDTSGRDWERTRYYGVNTLAFRMMQHGSFYCVDADCVGITRQIAWEKNRQWLDVLAKSGTPLFVSIAQDAFSEEVASALKQAFAHSCAADRVSRPTDWLHTPTPTTWESCFGTDIYSW